MDLIGHPISDRMELIGHPISDRMDLIGHPIGQPTLDRVSQQTQCMSRHGRLDRIDVFVEEASVLGGARVVPLFRLGTRHTRTVALVREAVLVSYDWPSSRLPAIVPCDRDSWIE